MRLIPFSALFLCVWMFVLGLSTEAWGDRRLSLSEAVKLALKNNPQLKLEQAKVEEAAATRKSARGHYGPKLMVDGNVMVWDSALPFEFEQPDPASLDMDALAKKVGVTPKSAAYSALARSRVSSMAKTHWTHAASLSPRCSVQVTMTSSPTYLWTSPPCRIAFVVTSAMKRFRKPW